MLTTVDSRLYALRAESGEPIWEFRGSGPVYSQPAIAGNVVYFGSGDGHMYALSLETGEELWRFDAGEQVGSPVPYRGRVLFTSGKGLFALE